MAETIRGINIVIGTDTTGLSKALKDVNENARNISNELRQVERLLKFDPKNTELLAQKQKLLSEQVENTREKLDRLRIVQEQVNEQFRKGDITEGQYRAFQRELIKTENQLKYFESQLKSSISVSEKFAKRMQEAGEKLQSAGKKMADIGKNLSMKVTAPIVAMGAAITKVGMDFEAAMSEVAAISGATGEELELLTKKAKEMGATTKFSASESAEALKYMAMAGWDTQQMLDGISGVMALAAASGENLGKVSDIVTDAITAFGMEAAQAGELADILAAASSNANTNVSMLGESFKYVAPIFGSLGYSAEDAALALGLMANAGIKSSQAGTTLRSALTRLSKPTGEAAELIQKLGIQLTDAQGNMLPFESVMQQLRTAFQNLTTEQQAQYAATIFGQQSMSGMLAIINASEKDYQKLRNAINESTGAAKTMADEMQDNLSGRLTVLKSSIEGVALQLFDAMIPALESVVGAVQKAVNAFSNLSPSMQKTIVITAGIAAALGPVLVVLGNITSVIGTLLPLLGRLATAIAGISAPVVAAVAGVAAFAAIAVEVYRNWNETKNALINIWELIKASAKQLGLNIAIVFEEMKATVLNVIDAMLEKLGVLEKLPFGIGDKFKGLKDNISNSADASAAKIAELKEAAEENGKRVSMAIEGTKVAFRDMGTAIANDVKGVIASIKGQTKVIEEEAYEQVEIVEDGQKQQSIITLDENQYRTDVTAKEEEKQTEIVEEEAEERAKLREQFERQWNEKLFELTASRLEKLEKEKEEALAKAEELGADKTAIIEYYSKKEQQIREEQRRKEEEARQREIEAEIRAAEEKNKIRTDFEQSWQDKLFELTATREELLEREKQRALARAEELGASKQAILEYYAIKERELMKSQAEFYKGYGDTMSTIIGTWKDTVVAYMKELKNNTEQASKSAARAIVSFADSVVSGQKTLKEALKEMLLNIITTLEQQVIAQQLAGIAISWAQAPATFGASLAWIPQIAAAVAPALATFEAIKAVIRGLATGGIVTGPTLALIGEGKDDEAVLPLNKNTLSVLGQAIAANMPQQQVVAQRPIEVKLQIGTLVADDLGLKKLERKLQSIRIQENLRLGVSQA